ncbi:hypothetical protein OH76DRAFT_1394827 [Lentinus brumalis]|uniref:Uncharacterized protein n=1 Tax=Lentinus brumalis TaxID=2498619 RepID=A0A371DWY2_9APHY|nr:hypothetical protein OH76DRAFT_1394827 [Polyporus brumalis]
MTACRAAIGPEDPHHPPTPASSPTHAPGSISPSLPRSNTPGASVPSMPPGVHNAVPCTQSPSRAPPAPAAATETLGQVPLTYTSSSRGRAGDRREKGEGSGQARREDRQRRRLG